MIKNNKGKKYLKIWLLIALTKLVECILNFFPIPYFPVFVIVFIFTMIIRSVYKELHADHETGAADNK